MATKAIYAALLPAVLGVSGPRARAFAVEMAVPSAVQSQGFWYRVGLGDDAQASAAGEVAASGVAGGNPISAIIGAAGGALGLIGSEIPTLAATFGDKQAQAAINQQQAPALAQAAVAQAQVQAQIAQAQSQTVEVGYAAAGLVGLGLVVSIGLAFSGRRRS